MLVPLAPIIRRATFQVVGFQVAKFVWLPQPIWNIFVKMGIFPEMVRGENEHVWNPPSFNCILSTWKSLSFSMPMMKRQVYLPIDIDIGHGPLQVTEIWAAWGPLLKRKQIPGFSFIRFPCFPQALLLALSRRLVCLCYHCIAKNECKSRNGVLKINETYWCGATIVWPNT